jgi:3-oxoadipate enol-lactonase
MQFHPPRFATVGGRRLAYEETAPADPEGTVLLLCGIGAKRQGYYRQLPVLGRRLRTLALDPRDVGDSDPSPGPYSIADVAEDVNALIGELSLGRTSLVGISMGGFVALELALRVCAAVAAPGWAERHPEAIEDFVEIARHRPMSKTAYLRQLEACRAHDVSGALDRIAAPTLVLHGDVDPLVPLANGVALAERIPGAQLKVYEDTGHIPEVERADEFNADLLAFLAA